MTVSDAQIQSLLILEVGDEVTSAFPGGMLATNIAMAWASYADKALIAPRLQELYTKRRCIDLVLGVVRGQVTYQIANDHTFNGSDKAKTLLNLRQECQTEIAAIEARARGNRGGASGMLTATAPVSPPDNQPPDANDSRYSGSPYYSPDTGFRG